MGGNNRINFLSALRNHALEPLVEKGGYDKVVFSNDIYIEPETIIELLNTADGEYDMACGMDFGHFGLYDMWVLRDKKGRLGSGMYVPSITFPMRGRWKTYLTLRWPYFFDIEDYEAMQTESPVPVFTCWNGIVVFKADPVLPIHLRSNRTLSSDPLPFELPATHPAAHDPSLRGPNPALTPPVRFRASAPGECFSSESFLLLYDFRRLFNMQRILVNPRVIVGYDWRCVQKFSIIKYSTRFLLPLAISEHGANFAIGVALVSTCQVLRLFQVVHEASRTQVVDREDV
ncbi:cryptococcal mannosyltransferase 1-domain-containing protein [Butyriboletus roseoflavus]|nr:cryptococcal mannosyltransferase 1-domain-containing protein [Butyriboletus roseoflavus]